MLPPGHALARKDLITPEDLADQVFVSYRPDDSLRAAIDALFESSKVTRILRYEASTPDLLRCMVASGMGVALASLVETGEVQDDFNVTLTPFAPALSLDVKAIWSRHRQLSALAQAFVSSSENWLRTRSAMT
jgi:DNA-binding transcriptional LysR family regulator